ncbi:MAG TPA: hypothetical protein VHY80_01535 [Stellaceae bacterium]|jgi:hypothetical protein|nr:hypothetical protein [Stellaceae bacterium]
MMSNITMTLLVALYLGMTAFALAAFEAHRHPAAVAVASLNLSR